MTMNPVIVPMSTPAPAAMLPTFSMEQQTMELCMAAAAGDVATLRRLIPALHPWALSLDEAFHGGTYQDIPAIDRSCTLGGKVLSHQALVYAACGGHLDAVKLLLEHGAAVNRRGEDGQPALHEAVLTGQAETVRHLVAAGADLTMTGILGHTPLMLAVAVEQDAMIGLLLDLGAPLNGRGTLENTALHTAAESRAPGMAAMVEVLLHHGADPAFLNTNGLTALDLARQASGVEHTAAFDALFSEQVRRTVDRERGALLDALAATPSGTPTTSDPRRRL